MTSGFDDFDGFDDYGDLFDVVSGDDARAAYAAELGEIDATDEELSRAQWQAAFQEYVDAGQITQEQLDAVLALEAADFDEFGEVVADVSSDSPDGDSL